MLARNFETVWEPFKPPLQPGSHPTAAQSLSPSRPAPKRPAAIRVKNWRRLGSPWAPTSFTLSRRFGRLGPIKWPLRYERRLRRRPNLRELSIITTATTHDPTGASTPADGQECWRAGGFRHVSCTEPALPSPACQSHPAGLAGRVRKTWPPREALRHPRETPRIRRTDSHVKHSVPRPSPAHPRCPSHLGQPCRFI